MNITWAAEVDKRWEDTAADTFPTCGSSPSFLAAIYMKIIHTFQIIY